MALKKCKECGHDISTEAAKCPNCGAPKKVAIKNSGCGCIIAIILALGCGLGILSAIIAEFCGEKVAKNNLLPSSSVYASVPDSLKQSKQK